LLANSPHSARLSGVRGCGTEESARPGWMPIGSARFSIQARGSSQGCIDPGRKRSMRPKPASGTWIQRAGLIAAGRRICQKRHRGRAWARCIERQITTGTDDLVLELERKHCGPGTPVHSAVNGPCRRCRGPAHLFALPISRRCAMGVWVELIGWSVRGPSS